VPARLLAFLLVLASCGPPALRTGTAAGTGAPAAQDEVDLILAAEPREALVRNRPPIAGRLLTREEARALVPLLSAATRIRGLRFLLPVPTRVQTQDDIVAFVRSRIDREQLEHARLFYVALGLLAPDLDVERMILAVMGEQIVGYYDPEDGVMVVREDVVDDLQRSEPSARDLSGLVLVHEYVHALQDQHLGLGEAHRVDRTIDAENAFASLVEGDATLAMLGWVVDRAGGRLSALTRDPAILRQLMRSAPGAFGPELDAAPPIVRVPLLSRYVHGVIYCAYLHSRGGFRRLNDAFRNPPESTEQILHPERFVRGDHPEAVLLPELPELEAAGFAVHDEDTLGELETSVYFAQGTDQDRLEHAAEGWGGDRIRVYRRGDETAVVWFTTWDDVREALEAEAAARRVADAVPAPRRSNHLVHRNGRAVLILRDLPSALHAAVVRRFDAFAGSLPARAPVPGAGEGG
jgi:hypothetical protein